MSINGTHLHGLTLKGTFRPYQRLALDAFEADRAAGRTSTHLVAPPGSGKTVLGLEIVRRLGRPALVLAPTATIATQWAEKLALFTDTPGSYIGPGGAASGPHLSGDLPHRRPRRRAAHRGVRAAPRRARNGHGHIDRQRARRGRRVHGRRQGALRTRRQRRDRPHEACSRARRGSRSRARRARRPVRASTDRGPTRRRRRDACARRVPPPRVALGLPRARRDRGSGRGPCRRVDRHLASRASPAGGRAVRRAARPGRLPDPHARGRARWAPRAVPGAGVLHDPAGLRA